MNEIGSMDRCYAAARPAGTLARRAAAMIGPRGACMALRVWRGNPYPLGATWDGSGVNFAIFSENAERVELCLFDADGSNERRFAMTEQTDLVWHCFLPD